MDVHLVAVQARVEPQTYRSAAAFRERTLELAHRAVAGLPPREGRVVAFPEAYALPLVFWLDTPDAVAAAPTALAAGLRLLGRGLLDDPRALLRRPAPDLLYLKRMPAVWPVYREVFSEAARATESYLVAGSLFGPLVDHEPARGLHLQGPAAYNWLALFSPEGRVLARIPKLRLTPDERKAFLSRGGFGPHVVHTRLGRLGVLICLDAFHEALVERVDAAGAWLLVQPSANAAAWNGPWSADPARIEGEVWLQEGLAKQLRGRENLRYGLNPMLNGDLYDLHFEGRSNVAAAGRHLALADDPTGDAVVRATVERPAGAG
ncbi:nitrilase-related carbon-nitrogen hydrolase [Oceanithermus sp.]|uniref:nitrilase-related carbon-nitrogen hydrolase n=1 Tax=Oceanithermus sp. TaxID=2268145 RepID=UPI00257DF53D|nr:nitrilase-related carbon-nitrogen hydrolase [Oceanithermus sp.]